MLVHKIEKYPNPTPVYNGGSYQGYNPHQQFLPYLCNSQEELTKFIEANPHIRAGKFLKFRRHNQLEGLYHFHYVVKVETDYSKVNDLKTYEDGYPRCALAINLMMDKSETKLVGTQIGRIYKELNLPNDFLVPSWVRWSSLRDFEEMPAEKVKEWVNDNLQNSIQEWVEKVGPRLNQAGIASYY